MKKLNYCLFDFIYSFYNCLIQYKHNNGCKFPFITPFSEGRFGGCFALLCFALLCFVLRIAGNVKEGGLDSLLF